MRRIHDKLLQMFMEPTCLLIFLTCPILSQNPRQIATNVRLVKTSCKLDMESDSCVFNICILSRI